MRYTLVAVIIMAGLLMGCVSSKNTPGQEKFCTDLVNALKLSGDSRTDRYSRCLSEMANPITAEPKKNRVTNPKPIRKSRQTLKENVTEIMKYGLGGAPTPVDLEILDDYDLCVSAFNALSNKGKSSLAYKNSIEEIRNRKVSCKEYSRTILAEAKLKIVEEKLEAAKERADQAASEEYRRQSQENLRRAFCNINRQSRQYKRTGYTPPSCY